MAADTGLLQLPLFAFNVEASRVIQVDLQWDIHLQYLLLDFFLLWEKREITFLIAVALLHVL